MNWPEPGELRLERDGRLVLNDRPLSRLLTPPSARRPADNYHSPIGTSAPPSTTLRGTQAEGDSRRVARGLSVASVVALAGATAVLFSAGVNKNAQITSLHEHGVPIEVTVSGCLGALSGSGSNAAGFSCRGTYTLDGQRYSGRIPGNTLLAPGTTVRMVTLEGHPGLIATIHEAQSERPSSGVFILPAVLLSILAILVAAIAVRGRTNRRRTTRSTAAQSTVPSKGGFATNELATGAYSACSKPDGTPLTARRQWTP
jgi:hypothetical protein